MPMNPRDNDLLTISTLFGIKVRPETIKTAEDILRGHIRRASAERSRAEQRVAKLYPSMKSEGCEWGLASEVDQASELARVVKALEIGLAAIGLPPKPKHDTLPG